MSSFPTAFSRAPTTQLRLSNLSNINRTNLQLARLNNQLASGLDLLRPSDDPVRSATVSTLDARIDATTQILKNIQFGDSSVGTLDQSLGDAKSLIDEAISLATGQINSDPDTRASQAVIVDSLIDSLFTLANDESLIGFTFGGSAPGRQPLIFDRGAYRFVGETGSLTASLGSASDVPLTLGVGAAIGELSGRIEGVGDLDPALTPDTLLSDLNGATSTGVDLGSLTFTYDGGPVTTVDLTGAVTVGDVVDKLNAALREYETAQATTVLGPGAVSITGSTISIDVPGGNLEFSDIQGGGVGESLGLVTPTPTLFNAGNALGQDLNPNLTWTTPVSALTGVTGALGSIIVRNNGTSRTVDLSGAQTLADIRSAIESDNSGVRLVIAEDGNSFNLVTESAGLATHALSVSQPPGDDTAERLGIRSFTATTPISAFNDGEGVQVVSGRTDPTTGLVDPSLNRDFIITLGDGFEIDIDLSPSDMVNIGTVVAAINAQADAALTTAGRPLTDFDAAVGAAENGIEFTQSAAAAGAGFIQVRATNNSTAAEQLGLKDASVFGTNTGLRSEDRATVRVNNMFSHLLDLAEALRTNDTFGIEVAAGRLQASQDDLIQARARVGGYAQRLSDEQRRQEDRLVLDESIRSRLRDLDYASASSEFSQLQLQLQAGLSVAAQTQQLSLLDFLG